MNTANSRRYLVGLFVNELKDYTFTKYIIERLAGDFACKIVDFIEQLENKKPVVDEQKKQWAIKLISLVPSDDDPDGIWCPICKSWFGGVDNIMHNSDCPITEAQKYLEELGG